MLRESHPGPGPSSPHDEEHSPQAHARAAVPGTTSIEFTEKLLEVPSPPQPKAPPSPQHARRTPAAWQVVISLSLMLLMAAATLTIYRTHQVAQSWQQRATQAETRLDELNAKLQASESDALRLEQRIGMLAAEKAQVEDEREVVVGQRDLLQELVVLSATVATKLEACVHSWERFTNALASGSALAQSYAIEGDRICGEAEADSRRLAQVVNELGS